MRTSSHRSCRWLARAIAGCCLITTVTLGADWPQWRGPNRDGKSADSGLLQEWPKEGPPLAWKIDKLGGGYSGPAIAAGRIFGMSNRADKEVVWALSEKDGSEIWATPLGPAFQQQPSQGREGPACTPTVDGERLYVEGLGGNVACLQVQDGKIVWQRRLTEDFGGRRPMWSYRESPLVDGDKVIVTPGGADAIMVALNKLTGETIWKAKMSDSPAGAAGAPGGFGGGRGDPGGRGGPGGPGGGSGGPGGGGGGSAAGVAGTKDPGLFASEHFAMRAFSCKIPNGRYLAKLYFSETYEGITGPGQRVFSYHVQGQEFKDFDIWAKAGGPYRAYVETIPVEVTDGEFRIVFTPKVENPAINAIEIIPPAESAASSATTIRIKAGQATPFTDSSGQVWQPDQGFEGGMMSQMPSGLGGGPGGGPRGPGAFGGGRGGPGGGAGAAYGSPIVVDFDGPRQYVQLTASALIGVAASDGKSLWRYDKPANRMGINCATPLYHEGMVFASSAYGAGGGLVKLNKDADGVVKAEEVYATTDMQNHHGGMVLLDGYLYGASGGNEGGALACLDFKTGKVMWDQRQNGQRRAKGSLALADGLLYYRMEDGTVVLIEPSPKQYTERSRFQQPDRSKQPAWPHPVIANGRLYLRDQDLLLCYDIKAK